jgi:hypothetical protein
MALSYALHAATDHRQIDMLATPSHQMPCSEEANCPAPCEMVIRTKTATIKQPGLEQLSSYLYRHFVAKSELNSTEFGGAVHLLPRRPA